MMLNGTAVDPFQWMTVDQLREVGNLTAAETRLARKSQPGKGGVN
jgi:CheY-specific phosphatase CheX